MITDKDSSEPLFDCFDKAFSDQPITIGPIRDLDYSIEIEFENAIVTTFTFKLLRERFAGLAIKALQISGTSKVLVSIPRVIIPKHVSGMEHIKFLQENSSRGIFLGIGEHGPHFINLTSMVHAGIIGSSGYGKTACVRSILAQLAFFHQDVRVAIIDPKGGADYLFAEKSPNVISIAKSLNEWIDLLSALVIEVAAREYLFSAMATVPPHNLAEYEDMRKQRLGEELPQLNRIILIIDEAHQVLEQYQSSLNRMVEYLARKARGVGINIILSTQRANDISSAVRTQINTWIPYYSPDLSGSWAFNPFMENLLHTVRKAIPGRAFAVDVENQEMQEIQSPYFSMHDVLVLASMSKTKASTGTVRLKVSRDLLDDGVLARLILYGFSLKAIQKLKDPLKAAIRHDIIRFSSSLEFLHEVVKSEIRRTTKNSKSNTNGDYELSQPVLEIPKVRRENNTPRKINLRSEFKVKRESSKADLYWTRRDMQKNPGLLEVRRLVQEASEATEAVVTIDRLILPSIIKKRVRDYCHEAQQALSQNNRPPFLLISGESGTGKRTLLEAIARELNAKILKVSHGSLKRMSTASLKENSVFEISTDLPSRKIFECACIETLKEISKKNHFSFIPAALVIELDQDRNTSTSDSITTIRSLGVHFFHIHLTSKIFSKPEIFMELARHFLLQYSYDVASGFPSLPEIISAQLTSTPRDLSAIGKRGSEWAKLKGVPFNLQVLHAIFEEDKLNQIFSKSSPFVVVSPVKSINDLIVSDGCLEEIRKAVFNIRALTIGSHQFERRLKRKAGTCILAGGPPGVGKSLLAEVVAFETQRDLWILDFGYLQSCYVGETEKILSRVFLLAEESRAVLLLDECDGFLRSRSEDRKSEYSHRVASHLLTLIDGFSGVLVLTTNFTELLDDAISRRCTLKINFELPDRIQMSRILKALMKPDAPLEPNFDFDAIFEGVELSGGLIRTAVERAILQMRYLNSPYLTTAMLSTAVRDIHEENLLVVGQTKSISLTSSARK